MKKVVIAFDVDGTLRCNREEIHREKIVPNLNIVRLWETLSGFKNVELHIWSNRGADYCREIATRFDLQKVKGYHKKTWKSQQDANDEWDSDDFRPDIAIDDQQRFDGGLFNLIVREK